MPPKLQWAAVAMLVTVTAVAPLWAKPQRRTAQELQSSYDAHKHEFDYLLGEWEITLHRPDGTKHGYWGAIRLPQGEIFDEYRLVDDNGVTTYQTTTIRVYNATRDQWELISMGAGSGFDNLGTGHWEHNEMHVEQKFVDPDGSTTLLRIRYHDIDGDSFLWNADRSVDGGKTWELNRLQIEARRIGPPPELVVTPPGMAEMGTPLR